MKLYFRLLGIAFLLSLYSTNIHAQRISLKTNALYWAAMTPNVSAEFRLSRRFTLNTEFDASFARLNSDKKLKAGAFSPELRYWFSYRPQAEHFVGVMALGSFYKAHNNKTITNEDGTVKHRNISHDGTAWGFGPTYGYSFVLGKHWSIETSVGAGVLYVTEMKKSPKESSAKPHPTYRDDEGRGINNNKKVIPAILKLGVSLVYIIR